ncbi:MAG TPA: hypothetical protein VFS43_09580 [Polyangiaceae bacterium]|nr:hypothetical protein [Polyangiaceae bacterium]
MTAPAARASRPRRVARVARRDAPRARRFALLGASLACACRPAFDERPGLVEGQRLLAVVAEPAEARPGEALTLRPLIAAPEGQPAGELAWSFCQSPKPPAEDNVVGLACLLEPGSPLSWDGAVARGAMPADACVRFGPDPPPGGARPRDPDPTGGFFQPILVRAFGEVWAHPQRVACGLPSAPADVARAFAAGYRPNRNPAPPALEVEAGGRALAWDALPREIGRVTVRARWTADDAETYLWWDPTLRDLRERRESMRLSWFVSGGRLDVASTGRDEADPATESVNVWQLPEAPGPQTLWVVLRDARGGAAIAQVRAIVE